MADGEPGLELSALAEVARDVAVAAGRLIHDRWATVRESVETKTTATDMVTEVDHASELLIARLLEQRRPGDGLVAEEGTTRDSATGIEWVVDPLDGTTNYLYGFPSVSVSIAAVDVATRDSLAGCVHDIVHQETFVAARGAGATRNGTRLAVAGPSTLATALVGTGFAYDAARRALQAEVLCRVLPAVRDIRRAGSAAIDLCSVASGRLDAYYENGLMAWDWAAGSLIASEAGALVTTLPDGTRVVAPPQLFDALCALVNPV